MAATTSSYDAIRPIDLQDTTLTKLNLKLQDTQQQLAKLGTAVNPNNNQTLNTWQAWTQTVGTILTTMTVKITSVPESSYLQQTNMMFINLDIQMELSGTATNAITFAPPNNVVPATNGGNCMACIAFPTGASAALVIFARTENNGIIVIPQDGSTFPLGIIEILVSGWYRI